MKTLLFFITSFNSDQGNKEYFLDYQYPCQSVCSVVKIFNHGLH